MKKKRAGILAASTAAALIALAGMTMADSSAAETRVYEVTVTNITPGQPLTPPLLVVHDKNTEVYSVGHEASAELMQLAENGDFGPLVAMLEGADGVADIVHGEAPLVPANDPGETGLSHAETFTVTTDGHVAYLSYASMLVCTNDGFAGLDTVRLPLREKTVYAKAYDARTEMNTEDFADLVPPCQGAIGVTGDAEGTGQSSPDTAEDGVIIPHPGIMGGAGLEPETHAWSNPVAKIEITRIS